LRQVNEVFVDDAAHAVARTIDTVDALVAAGFEHHPHQALVDHRGGTAPLGDEDFL